MLKLQHFGHLIRRADSLEKTLMLGKTEGRRRRQQRMRWLEGVISSMNMNLSKLPEIMKDREARHAAVHGSSQSTKAILNLDSLTGLANSLPVSCLDSSLTKDKAQWPSGNL